ncbi:hypothetical protein QTP70_025824 [Hemibagrus guttatus]|uniref:Alkylated DNA repair protein AlkB homologue 8 N-terminal domain-containing protein n=1 Tax=Hemibagrus guttatus TaxID=175788 RepID=A0AAE0V4F4_9TELE|nr:hypothetical protein QTP70_025824 [Hemibagrus guttatus]
MLFVDNTILPHILVDKLEDVGLPQSTCMWINSFLSLRTTPQWWNLYQGDESAYRGEVEQLLGLCKENNLLLNTTKTKELIIDYRRKKTDITPLSISGDCVERVADFQFLGVRIEEGLTWSSLVTNTSELLKKAQQRLYFLRALRENNITQRLLLSSYQCSIESILTYLIGIWFTSFSVAQRKTLQRVINMAQKIVHSQHWKNYTVHTESPKHP